MVDCYQGTHESDLLESLKKGLNPDSVYLSSNALLSEEVIYNITQNDVTDDRIFGFMTRLNLSHFMDQEKLSVISNEISRIKEGIILVFGIGASLLIDEPHTLVYVDMARWEIQLRMRLE